ncbi:hypothetical protein W02_15100 [Nitrospira sp. KM1]|nr:hypothetical protein W02_15100 [Nitrospira sp. KM1]
MNCGQKDFGLPVVTKLEDFCERKFSCHTQPFTVDSWWKFKSYRGWKEKGKDARRAQYETERAADVPLPVDTPQEVTGMLT